MIGSISSFGEDAMGELYICDAGARCSSSVPSAVLHDCNANGISDACDIAVGTSLDTNGDGRPDECCAADIDDNSFVNGDDYDSFAVWFFFGDPRADFDHNTFVNGDDFDAFYDAFFAGC